MNEGEPINSSSKKRPMHKMPSDFIHQFSSKADMISYIREQLQFYLPPSTMVTSDWVSQVIAGDKNWLECHEVVHANPPR